ncbi:hypothetical protein B0H14DRAFT_2710567 [Mycena olivaceomarginata]|nr:hypothetical protein B0H14DRAFT_2710567 [Mycena olivaceomarginata]
MRIRSGNLDPLARVWRAGGHIPALNCQRYDAGMQLNEGLFVGSPGWVLKPARLRDGTQTWMGKGFRGSGWWTKSSALVRVSGLLEFGL